MLRLLCEIKVGDLTFDFVHSVEIVHSWDNFTSIARITLPQRFYTNHNRVFDSIKLRDDVEINLGYHPEKTLRFRGFVTGRVPNSPLVIQCENHAYLYKQKYVEPFIAGTKEEPATLEDIISQAYDGEYDIFDPSRVMGEYRVNRNTTFIKILDELRRRFGLSAWWDLDGVLHVDTQLGTYDDEVQRFFDNANIISYDNMIFQDAGEFKQVVNVTSEQLADEDGNIETLSVFASYDEKGKIQLSPENETLSGAINSFNFPYLTQEDIESLATRKLEALNFTGYRGSFLTFGEPVVKVGDDLDLYNDRIPEMEGRYRVKSNQILFGIGSGYRQEIQVAKKTGNVAAYE